MRLIYYYLLVTADPRYIRRWINSIRSLRARNCTIPVSLFIFNEIPDEVPREAERQEVSVHPMGEYTDWMTRRPHPNSGLLASYPAMGQLLMLADEAYARDVSQALYVDCDTFFFRDPELLLDECTEHDWYGRATPGSRLCPKGPSANVDEEHVADIVARERLRHTVCLNTGVCIFNKRMLRGLPQLEKIVLDFAWRLMVGLQRKTFGPNETAEERADVRAGTADAIERLRPLILNAATQADLQRALSYPSDNWWILPEIAWLLALGRFDSLSQHVLSAAEVAQGEECSDAIRSRALPTIAHYFSNCEKDFLNLLHRARARRSVLA